MMKMKIWIVLILSFSIYAEESTYTESQLQEQVEKRVKEQLENVSSKNLTNFAQELLEKERKINEREKLLEEKENQLKMNELAFEKKIQSFNTEQENLLGCIDKNNAEKEKRIDHLVQVISSMKPVEAAELLSKQESALSVQILGRLEAQRAARIFNSMDKEISAQLQKKYMDMKR